MKFSLKVRCNMKRFLPVDVAWHVTEGLVSALARCHYGLNASEQLGLVREYIGFEPNWERVFHRDVKPANGEFVCRPFPTVRAGGGYAPA